MVQIQLDGFNKIGTADPASQSGQFSFAQAFPDDEPIRQLIVRYNYLDEIEDIGFS